VGAWDSGEVRTACVMYVVIGYRRSSCMSGNLPRTERYFENLKTPYNKMSAECITGIYIRSVNPFRGYSTEHVGVCRNIFVSKHVCRSERHISCFPFECLASRRLFKVIFIYSVSEGAELNNGNHVQEPTVYRSLQHDGGKRLYASLYRVNVEQGCTTSDS
jgi:hypothetical protein